MSKMSNALGQNARAQEPLLSYSLLVELRLSSISSKRLVEGRWRDDGKRHQGLVNESRPNDKRSSGYSEIEEGEIVVEGQRAW